MYSSQLLKGTFDTIILKFLSENTSLYGYELIQKIREISDGEITFPAGSLYPILHKLESDGFVTVEEVLEGKRKRRYYSLTESGRNRATSKVEEFMRFARTMITVLKPQT